MTPYRDRKEAGDFEPGDTLLDSMTKNELLAKAQALGISPANVTMSKAELQAAIEAKVG